jgi:hypothetical protein
MDYCRLFADEFLAPAVMVVSSPEVDRVCGKNNLTLAQILRPCGMLHHIDGEREGEKKNFASRAFLFLNSYSIVCLRPLAPVLPAASCVLATTRFAPTINSFP